MNLFLNVNVASFFLKESSITGTAKENLIHCGADEADKIFIDFHASLTGAHCGQTKTRDVCNLQALLLARDVSRHR